MLAAMMRIPTPAPRQLNGLSPPTRSASTAGGPNMPTPIIELSISAVRLQRPIVRTSRCALSLTRVCVPWGYSVGAGTGGAFIRAISASMSGLPLIGSRCG